MGEGHLPYSSQSDSRRNEGTLGERTDDPRGRHTHLAAACHPPCPGSWEYQRRLSPSTVQRMVRRTGVPTRRQRLLVLEHHSARTVFRVRRAAAASAPGGPAGVGVPGALWMTLQPSAERHADCWGRQTRQGRYPTERASSTEAKTTRRSARVRCEAGQPTRQMTRVALFP